VKTYHIEKNLSDSGMLNSTEKVNLRIKVMF